MKVNHKALREQMMEILCNGIQETEEVDVTVEKLMILINPLVLATELHESEEVIKAINDHYYELDFKKFEADLAERFEDFKPEKGKEYSYSESNKDAKKAMWYMVNTYKISREEAMIGYWQTPKRFSSEIFHYLGGIAAMIREKHKVHN